MKKLYNIFDEKSHSQFKFDRTMNRLKSFALAIGLLFFAFVVFKMMKEYNIVFFNKINPISTFLQNHGVNLKVIWNDCSPYILGWFVFAFTPLVLWSARNYKHSIKLEYIIKTAEKLSEKDKEIDKLKAENDMLYRKTPAARPRNERGLFLPKQKQVS